jgi:TetR/AcrR family transcriptional regulator, transcriptional repressor for nem operon
MNMSKKLEIILIAREIIHSKGYQATSINDILQAAQIGKGQFYHYFSSKYELGLAVVEDLLRDWNQLLMIDILQSSKEPIARLNDMLDSTLQYHSEMDEKQGCPIGNLAIEMSEHDEAFRVQIEQFFNHWIDSVKFALDEMVQQNQLDFTTDTYKNAQAIVSMMEGGILLMKNQQNIGLLSNVFDVIRSIYHLS